MAPLHGIFTPNTVPLHHNGDINEPELRRYIDWLIARGVHGIYPNGSSGEFLRFNLEERRRITRIVCEQCAGRVPVLAGATENNVREVIESCEIYKGYGARAVALLPPIYYKLSTENVYAYFAEIARNSPIDVTLYNIPLFCSPSEVPIIKRLAADFHNIIGMKDSSGDIAYLSRVISAVRPDRPEFTILTGWEASLVPAMLMGANGGTNATSGAIPELTRRLYDLCVTRQWDQAVHLQLRLIEFFDLMVYAADFPEGVRAAVGLRGFDVGRSRQPSKIDHEKLNTALKCVMSDFGVTDPPGSCPPRTSGFAGEQVDLERDKVLEVTSAVMNELKKKGLA
jgi:4-hydroxy-tetrahydrodipicolinate synthase